MKRLMLDHAFRFVDNVVFIVGPTNLRSQKALEKIGAVNIGRRDRTYSDGQVLERVVFLIRKPAAQASQTNQ
jgi:RimJ/RimL family protein N-acetyltransferase